MKFFVFDIYLENDIVSNQIFILFESKTAIFIFNTQILANMQIFKINIAVRKMSQIFAIFKSMAILISKLNIFLSIDLFIFSIYLLNLVSFFK